MLLYIFPKRTGKIKRTGYDNLLMFMQKTQNLRRRVFHAGRQPKLTWPTAFQSRLFRGCKQLSGWKRPASFHRAQKDSLNRRTPQNIHQFPAVILVFHCPRSSSFVFRSGGKTAQQLPDTVPVVCAVQRKSRQNLFHPAGKLTI